MRTVKHSGKLWVALGLDAWGHPIWPIEEYLAREPHKPTVERRIQEMNPDGKSDGEQVRGLFYEPLSYRKAKRRVERGRRVWGHRMRGNGIWRGEFGPSPLCGNVGV